MRHCGFIVGPERSGTTLTSAYLSSHKSLYVINDPHYLNFFFEAVIQQKKTHLITAEADVSIFSEELKYTFEKVLAWYKRWDEFKNDPVSLNRFIQCEELLRKRSIKLIDYFHKFHLALIPEQYKSKEVYAVKIPDLARYYQLMKRLYPETPVVFNLRHPVCNIASIIEPNYDRGWSFQQIIDWYKCFFPEYVLKKELNNTLMTRYEDLIYFKKRESLEKILIHFGLDSSSGSMPEEYDYPNKKVMRKTKGKVDPYRMIASMELMTPLQLMQALEQTTAITNAFYEDLSLTQIMKGGGIGKTAD